MHDLVTISWDPPPGEYPRQSIKRLQEDVVALYRRDDVGVDMHPAMVALAVELELDDGEGAPAVTRWEIMDTLVPAMRQLGWTIQELENGEWDAYYVFGLPPSGGERPVEPIGRRGETT